MNSQWVGNLASFVMAKTYYVVLFGYYGPKLGWHPLTTEAIWAYAALAISTPLYIATQIWPVAERPVSRIKWKAFQSITSAIPTAVVVAAIISSCATLYKTTTSFQTVAELTWFFTQIVDVWFLSFIADRIVQRGFGVQTSPLS